MFTRKLESICDL